MIMTLGAPYYIQHVFLGFFLCDLWMLFFKKAIETCWDSVTTTEVSWETLPIVLLVQKPEWKCVGLIFLTVPLRTGVVCFCYGDLFLPKSNMVNQRCMSEGLFKQGQMSQRQLHRCKAQSSIGKDSLKLHPWSALLCMTCRQLPKLSILPQQF